MENMHDIDIIPANVFKSESVMTNKDLILEILIRVPDFKTVIRLSCVSIVWWSVCRQSQFVRSFILHQSQKQHDLLDKSGSPYALLMSDDYRTCGYCLAYDYHYAPPFLNLISNASTILFPSLFTSFSCHCSFLESFECLKVHILASFEDLLLVQQAHSIFCIVNPVTKQVVELPPWPKTLYEYSSYNEIPAYRCGFVASSSSSNCNQCNYKVIVITSNNEEDPKQEFRGSIFSSETSEWSCFKLQFSIRLYYWHFTSIGCINGIIYWPFGEFSYQGIVAINTITTSCSLVEMPAEFDTTLDRNSQPGVHLGVARGQSRLLQLFLNKEAGHFVLKAWDLLESSSSPWTLVQNLALKWGLHKRMSLYPIAVHPEDEKVIFLKRVVYDNDVYAEYEVECSKNSSICKYRFGSSDDDENCCGHLCQCTLGGPCIRVLPLLIRAWPTVMPPLCNKCPPTPST